MTRRLYLSCSSQAEQFFPTTTEVIVVLWKTRLVKPKPTQQNKRSPWQATEFALGRELKTLGHWIDKVIQIAR